MTLHRVRWPKLAFAAIWFAAIYFIVMTVGVWHEGRAYAIIGALFATMILLGVTVQWRRRRRFKPGLCNCCAYDVSGNTTGVCPECGTASSARST
jgi:hypothetical protein